MAVNNLNNFISSVTGRVLCDTNKVLVGDDNGVAIPSNSLPVTFLPNIAFVFNSGSTETRQELTNAQFINDLGTGIAKIIENGLIAIAISGQEYGSQYNLNLLVNEAIQAANDSETYANTSRYFAGLVEDVRQTIEDSYNLIVDASDAIAASKVAALLSLGYALSSLEKALKPEQDAVKAINSATEAEEASGRAEDSADLSSQKADEAEGSRTNADNYLNFLHDMHLNDLNNQGDVNINNYRITNLKQSPEGDFDAVSFTFLWDLLHDQVEILWP